MVDIRQTISIPDTIDAINVPKVETVAVSEAAPNVAPEAVALQVSSATSEYSSNNTNTSQATYHLGTPKLVVHDTKWYKEDFLSSININVAIPDRDFLSEILLEE